MTSPLSKAAGHTVVLYGAKALEEEIYRVDEWSVIRCVGFARNISESQAMQLLLEATIDNPIQYNEQVFWTEKQ